MHSGGGGVSEEEVRREEKGDNKSFSGGTFGSVERSQINHGIRKA
jgi:hypothetical protein